MAAISNILARDWRAFQKIQDLVVFDLREVLVPLADRSELLRPAEANHLVYFGLKHLVGRLRADGHRKHKPARLKGPNVSR